MATKPTPAAYVLALTLRNVVRKNEERMEKVRWVNEFTRRLNVDLIKNGLPPKPLCPEDPTVFWSSVNLELEKAAKIENTLTIVADADYRNILKNALNRPWNKTRKTKGFAAPVPVLETLRRYGPIDKNQPMGMDEEMARMTSEMIWYEETKEFERDVDPIHQ